LTFSFLAGTAVACLLLGLTLGSVSALIPDSFQLWVDVGTSFILIALGLVLIVKPGLIHHHHDEEHGHDHAKDLEPLHEHHHDHDNHQSHNCAIRFYWTVFPVLTGQRFRFELDSVFP
jgi:nickel/cobalt exporter